MTSNPDLLSILHRWGVLGELDVRFARFLGELAGNKAHPEVLLAAALASRNVARGDVCLDLASLSEKPVFPEHWPEGREAGIFPSLSGWRESLVSSSVVGLPGDFFPLILDDQNRLYLYRYWEYEKKLADALQMRGGQAPDWMDPRLGEALGRLFPKQADGDVDWQKVACFASVFKRLCVISGGPGTGKTTTVVRILALLLSLAGEKGLRIELAAPTGKAAARLAESTRAAKGRLDCEDRIRESIPEKASTIHRLLGTIPGSPYFRRNSENPLTADVVVVDEASMVDLALMSKLLEAVPADCRVILLGDKDQLASVEAGSVLGDICDRNRIHGFSETFCDAYGSTVGDSLEGVKIPAEHTGLHDGIVILRKSYRFSETGGIGGLSRAINAGDADEVLRLLKNPPDDTIRWETDLFSKGTGSRLGGETVEGFTPYLASTDPAEALARFGRFIILCAVKVGPLGVPAINRLAERTLVRSGLIRPDISGRNPWYRGRPVLVTRNDYFTGLFNGDIGVAWSAGPEGDGPQVYFPGEGEAVRRFPASRLPELDTVYAMTIHKSQGSEFDEVLLILPDKDYPVLTRELLYTAVTRARRRVSIWAGENILRTAVSRKIVRTSGLRDVLWGGA